MIVNSENKKVIHFLSHMLFWAKTSTLVWMWRCPVFQLFVPPGSALSLSVKQLFDLEGSLFENNENSTEEIILEEDNATLYIFIR